MLHIWPADDDRSDLPGHAAEPGSDGVSLNGEDDVGSLLRVHYGLVGQPDDSSSVVGTGSGVLQMREVRDAAEATRGPAVHEAGNGPSLDDRLHLRVGRSLRPRRPPDGPVVGH